MHQQIRWLEDHRSHFHFYGLCWHCNSIAMHSKLRSFRANLIMNRRSIVQMCHKSIAHLCKWDKAFSFLATPARILATLETLRCHWLITKGTIFRKQSPHNDILTEGQEKRKSLSALAQIFYCHKKYYCHSQVKWKDSLKIRGERNAKKSSLEQQLGSGGERQ